MAADAACRPHSAGARPKRALNKRLKLACVAKPQRHDKAPRWALGARSICARARCRRNSRRAAITVSPSSVKAAHSRVREHPMPCAMAT